MEAITVDLGGADRLTTAQRQLVQRASFLAVQLEDFEVRYSLGESIEVGAYLATVNCQRRVLECIGLERRQRDVSPSLTAYLAEKADEAAEADRASECEVNADADDVIDVEVTT